MYIPVFHDSNNSIIESKTLFVKVIPLRNNSFVKVLYLKKLRILLSFTSFIERSKILRY